MVAAKSVIMPTRTSLVIGYYADIIFSNNLDIFIPSLYFILESIVESRGKNEVIARACVDTLSIIVTDGDTLPLLVNDIDEIVNKIVQVMPHVHFNNFFDFLKDFIRHLSKVLLTNDLIVLLFDALTKVVITQ